MASILTMLALVVLCVLLAGTRQGSGATFSSAEDDDEIRLFSKLFTNYEPDIRPVLLKGNNVTVKFGLSLHQIIAVDFKNQIVKSSVWIRQTWNNPYLTWNSSLYGGITAINVEPNKVWVPDIYMYNNADDSYDGAMDKFKTKVMLSSDGTSLWLAPKIISSSCKFDITYFPFDEQLCILKFGSWTYDGFRLNLINEDYPKKCEGKIQNFITNGEWNLVGMPCKRNEIVYVCCPAPYPDVTYTLHLRRRYVFYMINMIAPCFLISALTLLSFYLPPESGERLTLVITNLLALTVFMLLVVEMIPASSETVPLISVYFYGSMFEVALALIATCVVLRCYFTNPCHKPVPPWIRHVVLCWMARIMRMNIKKTKEDVHKGKDGKQNPSSRSSGKESVVSELIHDRPSRGLDSELSHQKTADKMQFTGSTTLPEGLTFTGRNKSGRATNEIPAGISAVTRDDIVMRKNLLSKRMCDESVDYSPLSSRASSLVNIKNHCSRHASGAPNSPLDESLGGAFLQSNHVLTNKVSELVEFARDQKEMGEQVEEWQLVAVVIDKFCLWIFVLILFLSAAVILMQAPRYVFG